MNQTAETCTIAGTTYTVEEYAQGVPVIELKMMSDYKWQLRCLQSRLQHPELYDGEDVQQTTAKLVQWLKEHSTEALSLETSAAFALLQR